MNVAILATCRKPELAPMTELVFKTLRVGFPTAQVAVVINGDTEKHCPNISQMAEAAGCSVKHDTTIHHRWIDDLIETEQEPFYVLDTDVIFYESFERFDFTGSPLAGYRIPEFQDEFMGAITRSRLHTSLLYIDPVLVRKQWHDYEAGFCNTPFMSIADPCNPLCLSLNGRRYFYDTCSQLYHAIGGTEFTAEQKDAYFHIHAGTIEDLVLPRLSNGKEVKSSREKVLANPELGKGEWRAQYEHYENRIPVFDGKDVVTPINPEEARKAGEWNYDLCLGNTEAMSFGDVWYGYAHGVDDLIDTMKDGRPTMSRDQIISLFFCAAVLYNHPFYMKNQALLYPLILETTNLYKLSAGWEGSPKPHLRAIADVLRSCGLKMHTAIALICGGESHMINIARRMYEKDWLGQHDDNGNPI
jgi:hypothetical protein